MWSQVDTTEKKVLVTASLVSAGHLFLIAYAAVFMHISVPTCQPNEKLFDEPGLRALGDKRYELHYTASMWSFQPKRLIVPVGSTVDFFLASKDVTHGFHVNRTHVNLMAVPGVVNKASHRFDEAGTFDIVCHEYCGTGHQNMNAVIEVSAQAQQATMDTGAAPALGDLGPALQPLVAAGRKLYQDRGCVACHSLDGSVGVGPSFKGLWGRTEELADGTHVQVDPAYISESIRNPQARLVKGFAPIMPALNLTEDEIKQMTTFLTVLR
jgi:cytochrome c oxidase subunit 2